MGGGVGGGRSPHGDVLRAMWQAAWRPAQRLVPGMEERWPRALSPAHGAEPEHAENNSVSRQCWQGSETEISTHGLEDSMCETKTAPSWRARALHPASPGSQLLLKVTWHCKGLRRILISQQS